MSPLSAPAGAGRSFRSVQGWHPSFLCRTSKELVVNTPRRQSIEDHLDPTTPTTKARRAGPETCRYSSLRRRDLRHGGHSPDPARLVHHHKWSSTSGTTHAAPPPTTKATVPPCQRNTATKHQTRRPWPPPPGHAPSLRTPQICRKWPTTTSLAQRKSTIKFDGDAVYS
jgi:hypothetical protein